MEQVQCCTVPTSVFVSGLAFWVSCLLLLKEIELIIKLQESKRVKPSLWDSQQIVQHCAIVMRIYEAEATGVARKNMHN